MEPQKSGSSSSPDDVAEHVFPGKARQTQKRYMWRHLQLGGGMTMKEWNAEYQRCGVESLPCKDLTQWIKA
eukprot:4368871-Ditylum_brightwellii.AAC.1